MSTPAHISELDMPYTLTSAQIAQFQHDGFIKLKNVLSPEMLAIHGAEITREVFRRNE